MGFYLSTDQPGQPLNVVYAEDIAQLVNVLTGKADAGLLNLLAPLAAPAAPSTALSSGAITGTSYQWAVYWITGILDGTNTPHITGRTAYGTATGAQNLTSQEATVSISGLTPPTGAIGWGVARTKSGGGTFYLVPGSEQFLTIAGTMPATFVDNTPDGSLVTAAQTVNSTGTYLKGPIGGYVDFAGTSAPLNSGLLLCDGSAVSRTTFALLFAQIGTTFGVGDGSTTFNLPDSRGRVMVYLGTNASVSSLNLNDGQAVANRRPQHRTSLADPGHVHGERGATGAGASNVAFTGNNTDTGPGYSSTGSATTGITVGTNNANDALDAPSYIVIGIRLIQS